MSGWSWYWPPTSSNAQILTELKRINTKLDQMEAKIMASLADFQTALKAVDDETTRIANYIQDLLAKLSAGGMTPDEEATALAGINAAAERLKGVGVSVEQPVPPGTLP